MGVKISPHVKAGTLSVANQQMLEIMRAVHAEHDVSSWMSRRRRSARSSVRGSTS